MKNPRKSLEKKSVSSRPGDVVLVIDTINDLSFPGAENLLPWARKLADQLSGFLPKVRRAGVPVVYVNDNFNRWHSSFEEVYDYCTRRSALGRDVSRRLKPAKRDYFILKPRHSAFFATSLVPLLEHLKARRLILSGIATNLCVLFTAHDAHMRNYPLVVLSDCCAAESDADHNIALGQLEKFCDAVICRSDEFHLGRGTERKRTPHS